MKEELRPCIVTIIEWDKKPIDRKVFPEKRKAYFHRWIDEGASSGCESIMKSYGIVEYEDGTVHKVDPECITFTGRDCKD